MVKKKVIKKNSIENETGLATSGFTLGILSILFIGLTGIILSIIGGIFCFVQNKKNKTKLSKVGLILNIIGLTLSVIWIVSYYFFIYPYLIQRGYSI